MVMLMKNISKYKMDKSILIPILIFAFISIITLYGASSILPSTMNHLVTNQMIWYVVGFVIIYLVMTVGNTYIYRMSWLLYGLGIWFAWGYVASGYKSFPSSPFFAPLLIACLAAFIIKGPIGAVINAKHGKKEGIGRIVIDTIMDFIVEVLEIFSGLLSNTLSFMRVAGLGIAHASLMSAFYQIAEMPGNIVVQVLIMIFGNVLVIVLEGLSAGIQSLRLNYYEFFTKYFTGHGMAFEPVGLKSRTIVD